MGGIYVSTKTTNSYKRSDTLAIFFFPIIFTIFSFLLQFSHEGMSIVGWREKGIFRKKN